MYLLCDKLPAQATHSRGRCLGTGCPLTVAHRAATTVIGMGESSGRASRIAFIAFNAFGPQPGELGGISQNIKVNNGSTCRKRKQLKNLRTFNLIRI